MFAKLKKKHSIILFALFIVTLVIGIHTYIHFQTTGKISSRAIAGWIVIFILVIHRVVAVVKDVRVEKLVGDPLAGALNTEFVEHGTALFPAEQKKKNETINTLFKEMKEKKISDKVFSHEEKKAYLHIVINHSGTLLITGVIVAIMALYRHVIMTFGLIGMGVAMFMGISIAAYFTTQARLFFLSYLKRRESKFFRMYRNALNAGKIAAIKDVMFFKNQILMGDVTLIEISDQEFRNVKFLFVFLNRFFLELSDTGAVNGIYEGDENLYVFQPLSPSLLKTAKIYSEKCTALDKTAEELLKRNFEKISE